MPGFVKRHPNAAMASQAVLRSGALVAGGVPTPAARHGDRPCEVVFDALSGTTGLSLANADLGAMLGPLVHLHRCPVEGLGPYDPLLRIRPRSALATAGMVRRVLHEPVPRGKATLHGDLHLGQFIRDPSGKVWIVDLDDLALGPTEADLANFAAYMATTAEGGICYWSERVRTAWRGLGHSCDEEIFLRFLRFALVRRHLKLRQAGRPDFEAEVVAYLRDSSNFSIL